MSSRLWCVLTCALLSTARPAFSQSNGITGVVTDPQNAVVPAAQVVLTDTRTSAKTTKTTDGQGRYSFAGLTDDAYVVEVTAKGFRVATSEPLRPARSTVTHDVQLALAGSTESVTVTGQAAVDRGY